MPQIKGTWECKNETGCPYFIPYERTPQSKKEPGMGVCLRDSQSPCTKTGEYAEWALTPETRVRIQNRQFREVIKEASQQEITI